jgi:hypothetical protein
MANYKCPNGLPSEECGHLPQLILNLISFIAKSKGGPVTKIGLLQVEPPKKQ